MFKSTIRVTLDKISTSLEGAWIDFKMPSPSEIFDMEVKRTATSETDELLHLLCDFLQDHFVGAFNPKSEPQEIDKIDFFNESSLDIVTECTSALSGTKKGV